MKNLLIKNLLKKFVFMLIKELIILEKFLAQFQAKETTQIPDEVIGKN